MRTRSTASSQQQQQQQQHEHTTASEKSPSEPSKTFILPSAAINNPNSRLVTLPDPRTGSLNRYFFSPTRSGGLYEFTIVTSPSRRDTRSILFAPKSSVTTATEGDNEEEVKKVSISDEKGFQGAISRNAEFWIATPVDFIFFMIPLLAPLGSTTKTNRENVEKNNTKGLFQPLDDIIDGHFHSQEDNQHLHSHLQYILYDETFRPHLRERVEAICDTVEAGDEKMFRFSEEKLLRVLVGKAEKMVSRGLPGSLEERFVRQVLVMPLMAVKRDDVVTNGNKGKNGDDEKEESATEKQGSSTSTPTSTSTPNTTTAATTTAQPSEPEQEQQQQQQQQQQQEDPKITHLLRLSTALSFIKATYLPQPLTTRLDHLLTPSTTKEQPIIDFSSLTTHLTHLSALRAEALASRSLTNFSRRKRPLDNDEDNAGKRRRKEEEEKEEEKERKRKAGESRGVRELRKVDTNGMRKMSDFFGKKSGLGSKG